MKATGNIATSSRVVRAGARSHVLRMLLLVVALLGTARAARAAEDVLQGDPAMEEQLKRGIALRRAGSDDAALAVFLDLEKRAPDSVRLLLHISTAAQATGKWLMAYDYLQRASSHKDDPYYLRHKASIDSVEKTIAQRVGQFRARGAPAGAEVRLNGEVVGTLPLTPIKAIEVGSYTFEVTKPGYYTLRRQVTIGGGGLSQETVELRDAKTALAAATDPASTQAQDGRPAADRGVSTGSSWAAAPWVTWALAGAGVAAAGTSGVAFVIRERKASRWNDDSRCLDITSPQRTREEVCGAVRRDAKVAETIGIAAGIGAITLGTAALIHGLTTRHPSGPAATSSGCSPGLGSIVCYGTF